MKRKTYFWSRLGSFLLDISAIYCVAMLTQILVYQFTFIAFGNIIIGVFIGYYFLSYLLLDGQTPAKLFTGLKIVRKDEHKTTPVNLLIREVLLKGMVGIIVPLYLFQNIPFKSNAVVIASDMLLVFIGSGLFLLAFKRTWWEFLSKTKTINIQKSSGSRLNYSFGFLGGLYLTCIAISVLPFVRNFDNIATIPPVSYPKTNEVRKYADFIVKGAKDPVDYLFSLFTKYDIVVISERMHPEYSQYEFIFKVLKDKRFSDNVGNIFTECGSVSYQDSLDHYLLSHFENEDALNRATARLQVNSSAIWPLWNNTNLYDMFKTVNEVNQALPDSNKIHWYFTDLPVNWKTATHETHISGYTNPKRDSLMAVRVIETYKKVLSHEKRSKALVIMNTYHGYGLAPNGRNCFGSTTGYIMKALPGKVANVMMNTESMQYLWAFIPVQKGKWDAAFRLLGNPAAGFSFAGSPFGEDHFDARFAQIRGLNYKDVFTGFIFHTPLDKQFCKNDFPFEFEGAEDEMIKRGACVSQDYAEMIKGMVAYQKAHPGNPYTTGPTKMPLIYNLIHGLLVPFLLFINLVALVILLFIQRNKRRKLLLTNV